MSFKFGPSLPQHHAGLRAAGQLPVVRLHDLLQGFLHGRHFRPLPGYLPLYVFESTTIVNSEGTQASYLR